MAQYQSLADLATAGQAAPPTRELFFWDFDGVLCDSQRETAKAGYATCARLWPALVQQPDAPSSAPEDVLAGFARIRPLLETGWQAVVMIRLLVESQVTTDELLRTWTHNTCSECLGRWGISQEEVMGVFNTVREEWIARDLSGWAAEHGTFSTALAAFRVLEFELPAQNYIITTKGAEFVDVILRSWGIDSVEPARIFGLGSGPKIATVRAVVAQHAAAGGSSGDDGGDGGGGGSGSAARLVPVRAHFVEDAIGTLVKSAADPLASEVDVRFYLARWGYNTEDQLAAWRASPDSSKRITVLQSQVGVEVPRFVPRYVSRSVSRQVSGKVSRQVSC
jgi:hypothetical protein